MNRIVIRSFIDRCGNGELDPSTGSNEQSPIFVQFLDAVYQVHHQYPSQFEYSEELLVFLADHVYSGLYGTFLHNSQQLRYSVAGANEYTVSVWSYVLSNKALFANDLYIKTGTTQWLTIPEPLWIVSVVPKMVLWNRLHCRWFSRLHPSILAGLEWHDNW